MHATLIAFGIPPATRLLLAGRGIERQELDGEKVGWSNRWFE
jgi:hypothetical protein